MRTNITHYRLSTAINHAIFKKDNNIIINELIVNVH